VNALMPPKTRVNALMPPKMRVNALMAPRNIRGASTFEGQRGSVLAWHACRGSPRTDSVTQHSAEIPVIGRVCLNSANE
jgi:hypothetical protein